MKVYPFVVSSAGIMLSGRVSLDRIRLQHQRDHATDRLRPRERLLGAGCHPLHDPRDPALAVLDDADHKAGSSSPTHVRISGRYVHGEACTGRAGEREKFVQRGRSDGPDGPEQSYSEPPHTEERWRA